MYCFVAITSRIDFSLIIWTQGVTTGLGAVWKTMKVEEGSSVAVFGLGAVGLAVVQGAQMCGASQIFAIDTNPGKFDMAVKLGATDCINPADYPEKPIQLVLAGEKTQWGIDYTFGQFIAYYQPT